MSRFIETIRVENGVIQHLDRHQERVTHTLKHHHVAEIPSLAEHLKRIPVLHSGRVRLRIEYDTNGLFEINQFQYMRKSIRNMRMMPIIPPDYRFKYAEREWINALLEKSGADEVVMIRNGMVTDTSIANIVFHDGNAWWTPKNPLLRGTERARLLNLGIIEESEINFRDLGRFSEFRLINAMLPWEDHVSYEMSIII